MIHIQEHVRRLIFLLVATVSSVATGAPAVDIWLDNDLGKDEIVLPGFDGVIRKDNEIHLGGGRSYKWVNSYLPVEITVGSSAISGPLELVARVDGSEVVLQPSRLAIIEEKPHHVILEASGTPLPGLDVRSLIRIEYDGLAMVTLTLTPESDFDIQGLDFRARLIANESLRMMAFDTDTIRRFNKNVVTAPEYSGKFLNAVGFADGDRSFWWLADNAEGWIWNADTVTEVRSSDGQVILQQRLIGSRWRVRKSMTFRFAFLATPVKNLDSAWRAEQIAARPTRKEAEYGRFHLWWTNVFAHETLPYTEYPRGVKQRLPDADIAAYRGAQYNRRELEKYRSWGMERLPYFSAHALTMLDPVMEEYRDQWEVEPNFVIAPGSDYPYTAKVERPWVSQRASGYADYLLYRFNYLIDELGLTGLYFDQASVIESKNPAHGAWVDSRGRVQASTDILAMRYFFKRLATLFYLKGKPGYIFVHNSSTPVIPAYTFVTSMLQGEEYVKKLKSLDYIDSISLDTVRTQYTTGQYGIRNTWLSELWSKRLRPSGYSSDNWFKSSLFIEKYQNLMALALLHDIQVLSLAPLSMRIPIYRVLSNFRINEATFHGYWNNVIVSGNEHIKVSLYKSEESQSGLLVVANLGKTENSGRLGGIYTEFPVSESQSLILDVQKAGNASCRLHKLRIDVSPKNYCLIGVSLNSPG